MKQIALRLSDTDHARLQQAAAVARMSMANYLMRLFDMSVDTGKQTRNANKREQAFDSYHALMDSIPSSWNESEYQRVRSHIEALRVAGGNLSVAEMPLPKAMVEWKNRSIDPEHAKYATWALEELEVECAINWSQPAQHYLTIRQQERELGRPLGE